ncbi:MAG: hypothetical protein HC779_00175 [Phyllobacteriaceae bacterium]|nr:hypothetical protein [Phyllobacteriaceae bacterium]
MFREWTAMVGLGAFPGTYAAVSVVMAATLLAAMLAPGVALPFVLIAAGAVCGWAVARRTTFETALWAGCGIAYAAPAPRR